MMNQNLRKNRREYFTSIASMYVGNGIWSSPKIFAEHISKKEGEEFDIRNIDLETLGIEFLDERSTCGAKYNKLFELSKIYLNKETVYYYKDYYNLCEETNFGIDKHQAKIKGWYIEKMLIDNGYIILKWDEYISLIKKTAKDNFNIISKKYTFNFFGVYIFDGRLVEDECISAYCLSKHFFSNYKTELKSLIYDNESSIIFGGKRNDSLRIREIAINAIKKESYSDFKKEINPILETNPFLSSAFSDRSTKGHYNQIYKLTKSFELKVPKGTSNDERLKIIESDMNQEIKKGIRKYIFFKDFVKDYEYHVTWLYRYFVNNKEGLDNFLKPLIKTKTEKSYEDILKLALTKSSFKIFKEECPLEYDYCSKNRRNWITSLRIDCEHIKSGWDDGNKKPKENKMLQNSYNIFQ